MPGTNRLCRIMVRLDAVRPISLEFGSQASTEVVGEKLMRLTRSTFLNVPLWVSVVIVGSSGWALLAQDQSGSKRIAHDAPKTTRMSVEEALTRPFTFPFAQETTLETVAKHIQKELGAQVVLDLAALKRLDIVPEDHVKLDLKDVRLKTGLKLLLDQVGLTYKVVTEDNLLIFTDERGADDPTSRIMSELKELHRDIHHLQDAFDDLSLRLAPAEDHPAFHKPTIMEDMPAEKAQDKPKEKGKTDEPVGRSRPGL